MGIYKCKIPWGDNGNDSIHMIKHICKHMARFVYRWQILLALQDDAKTTCVKTNDAVNILIRHNYRRYITLYDMYHIYKCKNHDISPIEHYT